MKDDKHTGCGIYPFLLKNTKFEAACEWHDQAYIKGSFFQRHLWTRQQVDDWFLAQMKVIAKTPLDKIRAYTFYSIARLLGSPFYEGPQK